jgi:hypothetical protein
MITGCRMSLQGSVRRPFFFAEGHPLDLSFFKLFPAGIDMDFSAQGHELIAPVAPDGILDGRADGATLFLLFFRVDKILDSMGL